MSNNEEFTLSDNHTASATGTGGTENSVDAAAELTEVTTHNPLPSQPTTEMSTVMESPQVLAALQQKMHKELENEKQYSAYHLPPAINRRVKALKRLQSQGKHVLADFYKDVMKLEMAYASKFDELHMERFRVITGAHEPTDEEASWLSDNDDEQLADGEERPQNSITSNGARLCKSSGIPSFWLTIFKNTDMLADMVHECDESILEHLDDIRVENLDESSPGFRLHFVFSENAYFTNHELVKTYVMNYEPSEQDPLAYAGPEITDCKGCTIDWKPGKDVTVKAVKKTQKNKQSGDTRLVHLTVPQESFFTFFTTKERSDDYYEEEHEAALQQDFELAHFIKESIVPNAVLYFTGEVYDYDGADESDDDELDEDEDELEGEDDVDAEARRDDVGHTAASNNHTAAATRDTQHAQEGSQQQPPVECKQQ